MELATFAAGCFWGVEYRFSRLYGVMGTRVGYIGGHTENPSYEDVCSDSTGHAEAVEVQFNPEIISYDRLLISFWAMHDPTSLNCQGADKGSQYRSVIFYHNEAQKIAAQASKKNMDESGLFPHPIVTEILPISTFYQAEEYHQKYHEKNDRS